LLSSAKKANLALVDTVHPLTQSQTTPRIFRRALESVLRQRLPPATGPLVVVSACFTGRPRLRREFRSPGSARTPLSLRDRLPHCSIDDGLIGGQSDHQMCRFHLFTGLLLIQIYFGRMEPFCYAGTFCTLSVERDPTLEKGR
jgi:hypothetical protein